MDALVHALRDGRLVNVISTGAKDAYVEDVTKPGAFFKVRKSQLVWVVKERMAPTA